MHLFSSSNSELQFLVWWKVKRNETETVSVGLGTVEMLLTKLTKRTLHHAVSVEAWTVFCEIITWCYILLMNTLKFERTFEFISRVELQLQNRRHICWRSLARTFPGVLQLLFKSCEVRVCKGQRSENRTGSFTYDPAALLTLHLDWSKSKWRQ